MFQMMSRAERTPLQLAQSTINLLNLLLFLKIFLLVTSISFISVALFGKEDNQIGSKYVALRDRAFLLKSGLYVGCVSLVTGRQVVHFFCTTRCSMRTSFLSRIQSTEFSPLLYSS